jgi:hypothetical protein
VSRTPILHVYVGDQGADVGFSPGAPATDEAVTIWAKKPGAVHWGTNGWSSGAQETPLQGPDSSGRYSASLGPFAGASRLEFVIHYADGTWGKAGTSDFEVPIDPVPPRVTPASPRWSDPITIRSASPGVVHWGTNGWGGVVDSSLAPDGKGGFAATVGPFEGSLDVRDVDFVIHRADGTWDNQGGFNYRVALQPRSVWWSQGKLDPSLPLTVFAKAPGSVHAGTDGWKQVADTPLVGPDANGTYSASLGPYPQASVVDFAVHYADGHWDNDGGADYHVSR